MNQVRANYFCSDSQFFMPLYYCLSVQYNFDDKAPDPQGAKWQGFISTLKNHISDKQQLDYTIKQIVDGKLAVYMNKSHYPTPQHIINLIRDIKRTKRVSDESSLLLNRKFNNSDKQFIKNLRQDAENKPVGAYQDFDKAEYTRLGRGYSDKYIDSK